MKVRTPNGDEGVEMPDDTPITNSLMGEDRMEVMYGSIGACYIVTLADFHRMREQMREFERAMPKQKWWQRPIFNGIVRTNGGSR